MKHNGFAVVVLGLALLGAGATPVVAGGCADDAVQSGTVCMDKYEASVWLVPSTQKHLIDKIQKGKVTQDDLISAKATAAGVVQLGLANGDLNAAGCPASGNGCVDVYAVSIPGVLPAAFITWFQAAAAARNSLKRLPTNQEWQAAALGTPDGAPCNVSSNSVAHTGSQSLCASDVGALDMVGNLSEWVAEWVPRSTASTNWAGFSNDLQALAGADDSGPPGALLRGGNCYDGVLAGVFTVGGRVSPSFAAISYGFRAAR